MKTKLLALIGLLAIVVAILAAGYFLGGFYSVAATEPEPDIVAWGLTRTRVASVARHATGTPPTSLDDAATVRAGAKAFSERGCANCHGAPGVNWAKWSEGLRPDPPDLKKIVTAREPRELFWVVKNGIKMTGMPSFGAIGVPDQEVWSMVAFLKKLPGVSPEDYKAWAEAR
jgi:mono/diheme cytochrome c family protein